MLSIQGIVFFWVNTFHLGTWTTRAEYVMAIGRIVELTKRGSDHKLYTCMHAHYVCVHAYRNRSHQHRGYCITGRVGCSMINVRYISD